MVSCRRIERQRRLTGAPTWSEDVSHGGSVWTSRFVWTRRGLASFRPPERASVFSCFAMPAQGTNVNSNRAESRGGTFILEICFFFYWLLCGFFRVSKYYSATKRIAFHVGRQPVAGGAGGQGKEGVATVGAGERKRRSQRDRERRGAEVLARALAASAEDDDGGDDDRSDAFPPSLAGSVGFSAMSPIPTGPPPSLLRC